MEKQIRQSKPRVDLTNKKYDQDFTITDLI